MHQEWLICVKYCISVPPEIIEYSMDSKIQIREGQTIELVCNATGVPLPVVTWYKQNDLLTDYSDGIGGKCHISVVTFVKKVNKY